MAAEVGGTFTDLVWFGDDGDVETHKVPSTPDDPSEGVVRGIDETLRGRSERLSQLVHGSTVATNAVIEREGCTAGLLTTDGLSESRPTARY